ncbi:aromatic acid exporter family protein [Paenibacillus sp. HN-1]|uniref:aromatic acid exporter family protein n=1 Tax=Paenibacillus TaxID=44249 RepID=UPI001CA8AB37|nr:MULTISPECIES: aromatic acid exporter family protein [Paenibacillus]MBY9082014.1 aromatic acid exporter family protein [Paenibacillus sp. CGMCC 1.18879]MBY9085828.1 aromatic acid exporter family protein [Paenibacillus sinensis]
MGFRIIKTAAATLLSVLLAAAVHIPNAQSAGLLAILGVEVTRKRSLRTITARFIASLVGLLIGCALFAIFGFEYWVLGLFVLLGFPLIVRSGFKEGIVTSSVIVFRVFGQAELNFGIILQQVELLIIGLGSAGLCNLIYMPKSDQMMYGIRKEVDGMFSVIFRQFAKSLRDPQYVWDGKELIQAGSTIQRGLTAAAREMENSVIHPDEAWNVYFYMRKEQLESIQNMLQLLSQVYQHLPHGKMVAELFEQLSQDVLNEGYTGRTEGLLTELEESFKEMTLPSSREEFEVRSAILQLCRELALYLKIAKQYKAPIASGRQTAAENAGSR